MTHGAGVVGSDVGEEGSARLRVRLSWAFCWVMVSLLGLLDDLWHMLAAGQGNDFERLICPFGRCLPVKASSVLYPALLCDMGGDVY
jgi:hypothetical protein